MTPQYLAKIVISESHMITEYIFLLFLSDIWIDKFKKCTEKVYSFVLSENLINFSAGKKLICNTLLHLHYC